MFIGKNRNGGTKYYPLYLKEQIERTEVLGRIMVFLGVPSILYFIFQDFSMVKLPGLLPYRLMLVVPFALYTAHHFLVKNKAPRTTELLHALVLTGIMLMSVGMNYYVHTIDNSFGEHSHQALGALIVNVFIVYLLSGICLRWLHLIIGIPYFLLMGLTLFYLDGHAVSSFVFMSNSTLAAVIMISMAFSKEHRKFQDFVTKTKLNEELELNERMTLDLKQTLEMNQELNRQLEHALRHDSLTEVYPRAAGLKRLEGEMKHCIRNNTWLALVFVDVDGLKEINDKYGHGEGDALLKLIASSFAERIRPYDLIVRMGGDEFLIALPECEESDAINIVNEIRSSLEERCTTPYVPRFSYGIAVYDEYLPTSLEELIRRADENMYRDKFSKKDKPVP